MMLCLRVLTGLTGGQGGGQRPRQARRPRVVQVRLDVLNRQTISVSPTTWVSQSVSQSVCQSVS